MGVPFQISRNPLVYPAGVTPGFDNNHVAARNVKFSGICHAGGFINLLNGVRGAILSGTPTTAFDAQMGWGCDGGTAQAYSFVGAVPAVLSDRVTMAAIFKYTDRGAGFSNRVLMADTNTGGTGVYFFSDSAATPLTSFSTMSWWGGANITPPSSEENVLPNTPVLVIMSYDHGTTTTNFLTCKLGRITAGLNEMPGRIKYHVLSGSRGAASAPDGTITVMGSSTGLSGTKNVVSACMYSHAFLSITEMLAWAADPWSFWYPNRDDNWIAAQAAAGFPWWAVKNNQFAQGVH